MDPVIISTVKIANSEIVVDAKEFKPDAVRFWTFEHRMYDGAAFLEVSRQCIETKLSNDVACGVYAFSILGDKWTRPDTEVDLPITPETVATLPPQVLGALYRKIAGIFTKEDVDALNALKNVPGTATGGI
jgi:hypothetical protein